jgi:hypothetical protein
LELRFSSYRKHWHAWVDLIGGRWNVGLKKNQFGKIHFALSKITKILYFEKGPIMGKSILCKALKIYQQRHGWLE